MPQTEALAGIITDLQLELYALRGAEKALESLLVQVRASFSAWWP